MSTSGRAHSARSVRSAELGRQIERAALHEVVNVGWDGLSLSLVAKAAEVSTRPLYNRYGDLAHVGAGLWDSHLGPELAAAVNAVIDAGLEESLGRDARVERCVQALDAFVHPGPDLTAAAELMLAARFDGVLHASVVGGEWGTVAARCSAAQGDETSATKAAFLLVAALGYLLTHRRPEAATVDIREDIVDLITAFDTAVSPSSLPRVDAPQWKLHMIEESDPTLRSVLEAMLHEVAERGYGEATLSRVCARSGASQGFVHARFGTKVELFIEATRRGHLAAFEANRVFAQGLADTYSEPLAEAIMMREYCDPRHAAGFNLVLEQLRLAWYDVRMREVHERTQAEFVESVSAGLPGRHSRRPKDHMHWNLALGFGSHLASDLVPGISQLPLDTVMVALVDAQHSL